MKWSIGGFWILDFGMRILERRSVTCAARADSNPKTPIQNPKSRSRRRRAVGRRLRRRLPRVVRMAAEPVAAGRAAEDQRAAAGAVEPGAGLVAAVADPRAGDPGDLAAHHVDVSLVHQ